jgi:hypothetical protein
MGHIQTLGNGTSCEHGIYNMSVRGMMQAKNNNKNRERKIRVRRDRKLNGPNVHPKGNLVGTTKKEKPET